MYIRLAHEMNLAGSPFGPGHSGNAPAAFVAAWRRVVTIFRQQAATNVEWVWSPMSIAAAPARSRPPTLATLGRLGSAGWLQLLDRRH